MPSQGRNAGTADVGLVGPGADEIDEVVAGVVGNPAAVQSSPSSFFVCALVRSERPHTAKVNWVGVSPWCGVPGGSTGVLRGEGSGDAFSAHSGVAFKSESTTRRSIMADYFTLLRDRVTLKCRSIDRIFLQAYVPKLQTVGQVLPFYVGSEDSRFLPRPPLARLAMPM